MVVMGMAFMAWLYNVTTMPLWMRGGGGGGGGGGHGHSHGGGGG